MLDTVAPVITARLRPPRARVGGIRRRRLEAVLDHSPDAGVIVLAADAGYGKTTAADALTQQHRRIWYSLSAEDRDPLVFMAHLLAGAVAVGADRPTSARDGHQQAAAWPVLLDDFLAEFAAPGAPPTSLVLDDYHHVVRSPVDAVLARMIEHLPSALTVVITTREHLELPGWSAGRGRGDIVDLGRGELAFDADETVDYCAARHQLHITAAQAELLTEETEGWPIGVSLLAQRLRDRDLEPEALLAALPEGRPHIFALLRDEVFRDQPDDVQHFLLAVSALDDLRPEACAALTDLSMEDARARLTELARTGVFCSADEDGGFRLHHLFRDFLWSQLGTDERRALDIRAAAHLRQAGEAEQASRHEIRAGRTLEAAADIESFAAHLLAAGRHHSLLALIDDVADVLDGFPALRVARSHALRLASRYTEALAEAAAARDVASRTQPDQDASVEFDALAASALVFLDTVQPAAAAATLAELRERAAPADPLAAVRVGRLTAENMVNAGRLAEAEQLVQDGGWPSDESSPIVRRLLVRRGELQRARATLRPARAQEHRSIPRSHREDVALESWVLGLLGQRDRAARAAREGIALASDLASPIIACLCWGRLGLAQITSELDDLTSADDHFDRALRLADDIAVPRFRAEPLIGRARIAHRLGNDGDTFRYGLEAIEILRAAGDDYLAAFAHLGVGAALAEQQHPDAGRHLEIAHGQATTCGDRYIPTIAGQWLAALALRAGDAVAFERHATATLDGTSALALDEVWITPSWVALDDLEERRTWLQAASSLDACGPLAAHLDNRLSSNTNRSTTSSPVQTRSTAVGTTASVTEPEPTPLRINLLGSHSVLRAGVPIEQQVWTRRKAMEILWLLATTSGHQISREQAIDTLWAGEGGDALAGRFRVALHALHLALEPDRQRRVPTRFVRTSTDRLWLDTDQVVVDVDEFRDHATAALRSEPDGELDSGLAAIDLYKGPLLDDEPYVEWLLPVRSSLAALFHSVLIDTGQKLVRRGEFSHAAALARRAIEADPYSESAYELHALAHLGNGDDVRARQVFDECRAVLLDDLGVEPSWVLPSR